MDDDFDERLSTASARLAELGPTLLAGDPWPLADRFDHAPEAAWGPREVLAHVAEMLPFWLGEAERVVDMTDGPEPFGRIATDDLRVAIIERDRTLPIRELLARIRAVLRRPGPRQKFEEFAFGDVRIRLRGRQAFRAGREVRLTRKEFDLLRYLVEHRGEVITRDRLLEEVWGYEQFPTTRTVDTHVLRLRQKFEQDPEHPVYIVTAHGQGYRFAG
jgi:DNA-binding winged helix-turn-helix (wHTH) protein